MSDIVITLTVKEPKKSGRPIIVSAAPAGEMPLIIAGQFAERHILLDQAFAQLLKRKPKVVKVGARHAAPGAPKKDDPDVVDPPEPEEAPAEPETAEAPAPDPEPLPVIEGDGPIASAAVFIAETDALIDSLANDDAPAAVEEVQATLF